jgi:hypothetical protein
MEYKLIVIWETGEKEVHTYDTEEKAESIGDGYKMAFGNQISWIGIRKRSFINE